MTEPTFIHDVFLGHSFKDNAVVHASSSPTSPGRHPQGNPKGIPTIAQGCEVGRATLGELPPGFAQPQRGCAGSASSKPQPRWGWRDLLRLTQGSSCLATAGLEDTIPLGLPARTRRSAAFTPLHRP